MALRGSRSPGRGSGGRTRLRTPCSDGVLVVLAVLAAPALTRVPSILSGKGPCQLTQPALRGVPRPGCERGRPPDADWDALLADPQRWEDQRAFKVHGDYKHNAPDFVTHGGAGLWLKSAPRDVFLEVIRRLESSAEVPPKRTPGGKPLLEEEWQSWVMRKESHVAAKAGLEHLLGHKSSLGNRTVMQALKFHWSSLDLSPKHGEFRIYWEVADLNAAREWWSSDKRPEQAQFLCQVLENCWNFTDASARRYGIPGPTEMKLDIRSRDFRILPVIYSRASASIGRWYGTIGMQKVSKEMRARAFGSTMKLVDATACNFQLLINELAESSEAPDSVEVLRDYIDRRSEHHRQVQEATGCDAAAAKKLFLMMLYGGNSAAWASAHRIPRKALAQIDMIVRRFTRALEEAVLAATSTSEAATVRSLLNEIDRKEPRDKRILSYLMMHREDSVMQQLARCLGKLGLTVMGIIHDAVAVFNVPPKIEDLIGNVYRCIPNMRFKVESLD